MITRSEKAQARLAKRQKLNSTSTGTQTGSTKDAAEGAMQVGQGHQVTVPRSVPHVYNNNYTLKLTYADSGISSFRYGEQVKRIFKTNDIYDPEWELGGHQPLGRDLWASMYDYYAVLSCEYEIHFYNSSQDSITYTAVGSSSQRPSTALITQLTTTNQDDFPHPLTGISGVIYPIAEQKNAITHFLPPERDTVFKGVLTPGDFIVDAKDEDSDNTWTAVGASPGIPRYVGWAITACQQSNFTGANETAYITVQWYAKLNYTVQFTQVNNSLRAYPS